MEVWKIQCSIKHGRIRTYVRPFDFLMVGSAMVKTGVCMNHIKIKPQNAQCVIVTHGKFMLYFSFAGGGGMRVCRHIRDLRNW